MKTENDEISLLCLNNSSLFKRGKLKLAVPFCERFGENIEDRVYLHTPSGDIWYASYNPRSACLYGLEEMMDQYSIKPYDVVLLYYTGGANFKIEIFNQYGVEVRYPIRGITVNKSKRTRGCSVSGSNALFDLTPVEIDKLHSTLNYNVFRVSRRCHDLFITKDHLENISIPLISREGCAELGLNDFISSIELSFQSFKWRIRLNWRSGILYFDNEWLKFAKDAKLLVGDICVIETTTKEGHFKVAILEKRDFSHFNTLGLEQGKSLMKCFQIMSKSAIHTRSLELPRLFMKEYGKKLKKKVKLFMPDGSIFRVYYCAFYNVVYGLHEVFEAYSIKEDYVLFFDYLGSSRFYVCVFDPFCMDVCNEAADKVLLKNLEIHAEVADIGETGSSINSMPLDHKLHGNHSLGDAATQELEENLANMEEVDAVNMDEDVNLPELDYFTKTLKSSDVDQKGHGVYCPRSRMG